MPRTDNIYHLIDDAQNDGQPKYRLGAVIALGDSGDPRAVRTLIECCYDDNPDIRMYAIEALGKLRSGRSGPALIARLNDRTEQPGLRKSAAAALAAIGSFGAIEALNERALDTREEQEIRSCCTDLLVKMGIR